MSKNFRVILIINISLIIIFILACGNKNHNKNDHPQELIFKVNPSLLGEKFLNEYYGFSFSPPKRCLQLPEEMVQKVKEQLKKEYSVTNSYILEPYQLFLNEKNRFACLISILPNFSNADSAIAEYQQAIFNYSKDRKVTQTIFLHNGFRIYQSLIINENMIQFKLVVPQTSNKSFQIDYVIPTTIYQDNVETIESSIGSLLKL